MRDRSLEEYVRRLGERAGLGKLDYSRIRCVRSYGSRSRLTAARIHAAGRALSAALGLRPFYVIEFVSELFDSLGPRERDRVILHELLHIPSSMGGGLVGHGSLDFDSEVRRLERRLRRE